MASTFELYLIRHAQSANNALPESQRVNDPSLTDVGFRQADLLASQLAGVQATHLLTSGFLRAVQTMQPVAKSIGKRPAIWTDLHEVGGCFDGWEYGKLEGRPGMNRATLVSEFPEFELPDDIGEEGWWKSRPFETHAEAQQRAARQATRLLDEFLGTDSVVMCVIHADFKALLLQALLGDSYGPFSTADLLNTGVTRLDYADADASVEVFNDSTHLPEELVTS